MRGIWLTRMQIPPLWMDGLPSLAQFPQQLYCIFIIPRLDFVFQPDFLYGHSNNYGHFSARWTSSS